MTNRVDKEYGRKPYMSKDYREMMRRPTNFHLWNQSKPPKVAKGLPIPPESEWYTSSHPHSEFEKPYKFGPGDYPEMQHYPESDYDYDVWPYDTLDDDVDGIIDQDPTWRFLGCDLKFPGLFDRMRRCEVKCVELSKESMSWRDGKWVPNDPIVTWEGVNGDVLFGSAIRACIWAKETVADGDIVSITGITESGEKCTSMAWVKGSLCDTECTLAWDSDTSISTIGRNTSGVVAVTDSPGDPPYQWAVSGTGFTLQAEETQTVGNTLITDGSACGHAIITVTNANGCSTTGSVNATEGSAWIYQGAYCGLSGVAAVTTYSSYGYIQLLLTDGYKQQWQQLNMYGGGNFFYEDAGGPPYCSLPSPCEEWIQLTCGGAGTYCLDFVFGPALPELSCLAASGVQTQIPCAHWDALCRSGCGCQAGYGWTMTYYEWISDEEDPNNIQYREWECS